MADRKDLPPDPFVREVSRLREPRRMETIATTKGVMPEYHMAARVSQTGTQNTNNATATTVQWNSVVFDTHGLFEAANFGFRIPSTGKITGLWVFHSKIVWSPNAVGQRTITLREDGVAYDSTNNQADNSVQTVELVSYILNPNAARLYTITALQASGGALNLDNNLFSAYFEVFTLW